MNTENKLIQRARLTHAAYHRVCVYLGSLVDPGTQDISATLTDVELLVAQNLGVQVSAQQVRAMCKELGLNYRSDNNGAVTIARLQLSIDAMQHQLDNIEAVLKQYGEYIVQLQTAELMDSQAGGST